ncbi:MAG: hypothetical protein K6F01_05070 [Selenomonas sp.]|uniref:hypothetical protein n=1 Tax=Selenomonas sp. TaxID=2053611 RepID=UPI0025F81ABA|nr:hypothetical protein [Selenomonas sp.]MCR5438789.1 hypothetical protein [Selenomonas sp.]
MLGIQCYAIFWLLVSGYALQTLLVHTGPDIDDEERKQWQDEIESMGKFMSGRGIGKMFLLMSMALLMIDGLGFFFTYQYAELRPWQQWAFYFVAAALIVDSLVDFYRMRKLLAANEPDEIAHRMSEYMDVTSVWANLSMFVVGGKCLLAVVLVLWTVFR